MRYPAHWGMRVVNEIPVGVTMKGSARAVLRKTAIIILLAVGLSGLPGCAVVGPLLSVGGMAGLAPLQYASSVYTVGEFTYEYAANDKDPGEVIQAKIDGVVTGDAFTLPDSARGYDAPKRYEAPRPMPDAMLARVETGPSAGERDVDSNPSLSASARQKRVEQLLGRRTLQFERLETRRMAFQQSRSRGRLTLRQTAMASTPNLFQGAKGETTLR
ncbi:hypothetical protein Daes_0556 [Pseudodesulfovibrio aespoeensis Aspo-2]|uniref:Uncharacterized protein n=2 Tax=Desulfovibrionaceae TaxID=194924 RepID=E6VYB8_PSEA9|nr:hypothetical protein Daes_0556 [Pseudodesulfovibrio aespoeensis Aspo-2]